MPMPPSDGPELEQLLLQPPNARQQWSNSLSESNLRRVIKLFPFGRMRREAILRKLQLRFNQALPIIHQIKHNLAFKSNSNGFMLHAWFPLSSGLEFAQLHNQGVGWRSWPIGGFFKNHLNIRRHWPTIHLKFPQMPVAVNRNSPREGPLVMV